MANYYDGNGENAWIIRLNYRDLSDLYRLHVAATVPRRAGKYELMVALQNCGTDMIDPTAPKSLTTEELAARTALRLQDWGY